jgi:hypothetical protein
MWFRERATEEPRGGVIQKILNIRGEVRSILLCTGTPPFFLPCGTGTDQMRIGMNSKFKPPV